MCLNFWKKGHVVNIILYLWHLIQWALFNFVLISLNDRVL